MFKEKPLIELLYQDPLCIEIARFVGYGGTVYRDHAAKMVEWNQQLPRRPV